MFIPFRALMLAFALISGLITSYSVFAQETELFDRLDGTGPSHKKVDVIEWEGNLEVHVYPKGSMVKGFSAKLDDRTEGKKVMVIGYRFEGMKKPLVRRAILGVPFTKDLKAYVDPTQKDFDKFALSNQVLPKPFIPYKMEPAPKQWYPDGDPRNEDESSDRPILTGTDGAVPAAIENKTAVETKKVPSKRSPASAPVNDNADAEGGIKSFSW